MPPSLLESQLATLERAPASDFLLHVTGEGCTHLPACSIMPAPAATGTFPTWSVLVHTH